MMAKCLKLGMFAALALSFVPQMSPAGERLSGRHEQHAGPHQHTESGYDSPRSHRQRDVVGGNGLPSVVAGVGTFAGGISAVRIRGNGIYFASDVTVSGAPGTTFNPPSAKIILVDENFADNAFRPHDACAYENGVCVIRGRR